MIHVDRMHEIDITFPDWTLIFCKVADQTAPRRLIFKFYASLLCNRKIDALENIIEKWSRTQRCCTITAVHKILCCRKSATMNLAVLSNSYSHLVLLYRWQISEIIIPVLIREYYSEVVKNMFCLTVTAVHNNLSLVEGFRFGGIEYVLPPWISLYSVFRVFLNQ